MKAKIVTSVEDNFCESTGPSTTTTAYLWLDGMMFGLGRFYEGPYMNEGTAERLAKIMEFAEQCKKNEEE